MSNRIVAHTLLAGLLAVVVVTFGCGDSPAPPLTAPTPTPAPTSTALTVTVVAPSTGLAGVATPVRIGGTGFLTGATVTFDGVPAPATVVSSVSISTTAAAHALGTVDVVVTNPGGESSRLADGFAYVAALTSLTISGNTSLAGVGETSQLTATAGYSDGTTRDVTSDAQWSSNLPSVVTISTGGGFLPASRAGLLTAQALGATSVLLRYPVTNPSLYRYVQVTVTPIGTFTASGRVREPGVGSVTSARVVNVASGLATLTQSDGDYSFGGLTDPAFSVTKAGYEPVEFDATPDVWADVPVQRVVRIAAGSAGVSGRLAPNDMDYVMSDGTHCQPCRLIRVTSTAPGMARVQLTWTDPDWDVNIWVNGQMFPGTGSLREVVADVLVGAGEVLMYVGKIGSGERSGGSNGVHVPFTLSVTAPR